MRFPRERPTLAAKPRRTSMDETAVFNRSLWDVTGLAREVCQRNGDVACASRERMPARGSIAGRGWVGGHLMPKEFWPFADRSEEHTSELQSLRHLVCRLLLEKKK